MYYCIRMSVLKVLETFSFTAFEQKDVLLFSRTKHAEHLPLNPSPGSTRQ